MRDQIELCMITEKEVLVVIFLGAAIQHLSHLKYLLVDNSELNCIYKTVRMLSKHVI